jgi:phospholipase/carboxylesterase
MNRTLLDAIVIEPRYTAHGSLILLHGLGANGHDFEPLIPELDIVDRLGVRVILPHAPHRPVTINAGMRMPAWYDIADANMTREEDSIGIRESGEALVALIERELEIGLPADRVVLAGFSQGGAIALYAGMRYTQQLAGIMVLSAYLPLATKVPEEAHPANRATPIMMAHGTTDPVVPLAMARDSCSRLKGMGYNVQLREYAMMHGVCPEEIRDIRDWLHAQLAPDCLV